MRIKALGVFKGMGDEGHVCHSKGEVPQKSRANQSSFWRVWIRQTGEGE
ncbi:unnamed protein product, partial [Ixodes pacificus]